MTDVFFVIIIIIALGLIGGLLYLLYLPLKKRLLKSGKISDKTNRQINWLFIVFLGLIGVILYYFKDYRTPSKNRLERISDVQLPTDYEVLKDEYQDMLQDYCIIYEIQFNEKASKKLISNIRTSKFYTKNSFTNELWKESDSVISVWSESKNGYVFNKHDGLTTFSINFDTITNVLKYNECAD